MLMEHLQHQRANARLIKTTSPPTHHGPPIYKEGATLMPTRMGHLSRQNIENAHRNAQTQSLRKELRSIGHRTDEVLSDVWNTAHFREL
jgi:hypothetical protein